MALQIGVGGTRALAYLYILMILPSNPPSVNPASARNSKPAAVSRHTTWLLQSAKTA